MAEFLELFAFVATFAVILRSGERTGLSLGALKGAGLLGIVGSIAGGYLVAHGWASMQALELRDWPLEVMQGEKAAFGAFAGAAFFGAAYLKIARLPVLRYADAAVPAVALGYAITRVGCFLAGCCYGVPTRLPWGVTYPPGSPAFSAHVAAGWIAPLAQRSLSIHPTQLYSAGLGLVGFWMLGRMHDTAAGSRLSAALILYGTGRFVIEFWRADATPVVLGLDMEQGLCVVMILLGGCLADWRRAETAGRSLARCGERRTVKT